MPAMVHETPRSPQPPPILPVGPPRGASCCLRSLLHRRALRGRSAERCSREERPVLRRALTNDSAFELAIGTAGLLAARVASLRACGAGGRSTMARSAAEGLRDMRWQDPVPTYC